MRSSLMSARSLAATVVNEFNVAKAWMWEQDGSGGKCERQVCLTAARQSDFFILLLRARAELT